MYWNSNEFDMKINFFIKLLNKVFFIRRFFFRIMNIRSLIFFVIKFLKITLRWCYWIVCMRKTFFLTLNQRLLKTEYIENKTCCEKKFCFQSYAKLINQISINSSKLYWNKKCRITNYFCMNTSTFFVDIKRDRYESFWILKTWIWNCNCCFWCCFFCMFRFFDCLLVCFCERTIANFISMINCMIVEIWNVW